MRSLLSGAAAAAVVVSLVPGLAGQARGAKPAPQLSGGKGPF